MKWDEGLTPEQKDAASHWGGSARVLAGPGTGKTLLLIHRINYLMQVRNVPSKKILAITFTRAAAKEIKERLNQHLGLLEEDQPWVGTLHSFALRVLLKHHQQSGIIQPLFVADDFEEQHVIFPEIGRMIRQSNGKVEEAYKAFQAIWNTLDENTDWQEIGFRDDFVAALEKLRKFYGFNLRGELVYRLWKLLDENPVIGSSLGYQHILVDEYQDLNLCDHQVINAFEEHLDADLFIVGDDDQSIYEFRHAYPEGIRDFVEGRENCGNYELSICHRCPTEIIQRAWSLINRDRNRAFKHLSPHDSAIPGEVYTLQFQNSDSEAQGIASICRHYVEQGFVKPGEISILLSVKSLVKPIIEALENQQLAWADLTPIWPLGSEKNEKKDEIGWEGREYYCLLRLLNNQQDALALRTWLGMQQGVGEKAIDSLREYCIQNNLALHDGLEAVSQKPSSIQRHGSKLQRAFDQLIAIFEELDSYETLEDTLDNLMPFAQSDHNLAIQEIRDFLDLVIRDEEVTELSELIGALQRFHIQDVIQLESDAIRVITMHKAKGLSSKLVIIPGLEHQWMPGPFAADTARRMMYVSVTRSANTLFLTHALRRSGSQYYQGNTTDQDNRHRSPYIREMNISRSSQGTTFVRDLQMNVKHQAASTKGSGTGNHQFDVFLCHNSNDKSDVRDISKLLKKAGCKPWLDEEQLQPGLPWQRALEKEIKNIGAAAVFVGKNGIGPWQQQEYEALLRQFVKCGCPVIPVILPNCTDVPDLPVFLEGMTWADFRKSQPDPLQRLIWGITGNNPHNQ